jgi:HEAT repeat protein
VELCDAVRAIIPLIVELLDDQDAYIRSSAASALGKLHQSGEL